MKTRLGVARWLLIAVAITVLIVAQQTGLLSLLADPPQVRTWLLGMGSLGGVMFVLVYAFLQPLGVPGTVFVLAAPLIWPWPQAYAATMLGTMLASINGFLFARFVARDYLASRVPERFQRYNEALEKHAFWTVAVLRFVFWMPQVLHTFLGVSRVGFWPHFWGSLVGYAVPLFLSAYYGEAVFLLLRNAPPSVWFAMLGLTAVALFVAWRLRKKAEPLQP